jgi:hypothetical protein
VEVLYRRVISSDRDQLFALAKKLATSFEPNSSDFDSLINDKSVDLIVAEKD